MDLNVNICHDLHRGRTISKEFTICKIGETGFGIVEEHVVDCLEIGSQKKRRLWKRQFKIALSKSQINLLRAIL